MFSRPEKNRVCVGRSFIRKRRDVQATEHDICSTRTIMVGDPVRTISIGDVNMNNHQVRLIVEVELLNVLILQGDLEVRIEIRSQRCQTKRGKKGVLDWSPEGTRSLGQRRQNTFDASD